MIVFLPPDPPAIVYVAPPKQYTPTLVFKPDAPSDDAFKVTAPAIDQVELGALSLVDMEQTNIWLHTKIDGHPRFGQPDEQNPLLGKHPSMTRMLVTGAVMDTLILHLPSPALRRFAIAVEATNVAHNFSIGMHL